jgi:cytoskeletal protein CcmA (bactofilin family)
LEDDDIVISRQSFEGSAMFDWKGRERVADRKEAGKAGPRPAVYEPPGAPAKPGAATTPRFLAQSPATVRDTPPAPAAAMPDDAPQPVTAAQAVAVSTPRAAESAGSKLSVGINIRLKGMEISDCDLLVIEGHVEATVHSQGMQIAKPGTLEGTAVIDVAEVHGEFSGELTARTRLVVHGTGRVTGIIRYGQLIVEEGGEISGDVKRLDTSEEQPRSSPSPNAGSRNLPQPARGPLSG